MKRQSALRSIREALAGTHEDFTEGNLSRAITLLAIPMVLEMSMESLFGIVDVFFVARLGADAVATVGVTEGLLTIVFALALGLSMATTAMVARRIGEKNREGAADAAVQALVLGALISLPTGLVGALFAPKLLTLMGAPEGVVATGWGYTAVMLGGNVSILGLFLINAIFRGAGDAAVAMRVLWAANMINIALDPCFIFGLGPFPELGITGAAVASNIGRSIGVLYQLWILFGGRERISVARRNLRVQPRILLDLARVSIGGVLQMIIATASWLGLVRILTPFGSAVLAGYTIAIRIIIVTILPSWGMSNAAATLVGQNLGAAKPDRAERATWLTGLYNMIFLALVAVVFISIPDRLIGIFTQDPAIVAVGVDCLRFISYGYIFYAWGMVMVQAFNGAGDTMTPTWINLGCYWMFQIPLAWTLARPLGYGPRGVFLAILLAESLLAVVGILWFRTGRWKTRTI